MIEIIVDVKTAKERLFDTYIIITSEEKFTPKNNEIRKYCEFLKSYVPPYNKEVNFLKDFFVMEIDKKDCFMTNSTLIRDNESFLFEFPDDYPEEEIFYFKLKYC